MKNDQREITYRRMTMINHPISGEPIGCNFELVLRGTELLSDICGTPAPLFKRTGNVMAYEVANEYEDFLNYVLDDLKNVIGIEQLNYEHMPEVENPAFAKYCFTTGK